MSQWKRFNNFSLQCCHSITERWWRYWLYHLSTTAIISLAEWLLLTLDLIVYHIWYLAYCLLILVSIVAFCFHTLWGIEKSTILFLLQTPFIMAERVDNLQIDVWIAKITKLWTWMKQRFSSFNALFLQSKIIILNGTVRNAGFHYKFRT